VEILDGFDEVRLAKDQIDVIGLVDLDRLELHPSPPSEPVIIET
jgi:hypothetical protein